MSLLEVKDLRLSIDKKTIVEGVTFALQPGETVALVGASGCGKSMTAQSILLPVAHVDKGAIWFEGENLLCKTPREMQKIRGKKIGMIFQDPTASLNPTMTIGRQLVETLRTHLPLTHLEAEKRAIDLLHNVGISDPTIRFSQYPFELSGGMRQRVMIAIAISCDPVLLIADEPTTALDLTIQAQILALLKEIQQLRKLALFFISHDLGVVAGISDRVLVMSQGKIVEEGSADKIFYEPQHPYTRALLKKDSIKECEKKTDHQILLTCSNLRKEFSIGQQKLKAVSSLDLEIYKGETLGLVGESGSGKSTLGKLFLRLLDPSAGTLHYDGIDLLRLCNKKMKALRQRLQMLFQNPYGSLDPRMRVSEILKEPFEIHNLPSKDLSQLLDAVGLSSEYLERYPHQLSGGQRQRIALARALAIEPEFLVCDEPLSALDATSQHQVLALLKKLKAEKNLTYLFISHDLNAVKAISDRVAVLYLGQLMELAPTEQLFTSPSHPYTKALIAAIPQPDPRSERKRERLLLKDDPPSPLRLPQGCVFQTRCPYAQPICKSTPPPLVNFGHGRQARCHLF